MRCVLFDVDGVLVHGYHARPELLQNRWDARLLEDLGVDPQRFKAEFIYDLFVKKVIVGEMALVEALDRVLPRLGYRGATMDFVTYWLANDSHVDQALVDAVRRLKAAGGCRLYVATNQEHLRAHWLWHALGLREMFEDIFYSARVGAIKPHAPFFDFVARRIGPQDEPPLFFDDREDIVTAARERGWEAVLYTSLLDCVGHPWVAERLDGAPTPAAR